MEMIIENLQTKHHTKEPSFNPKNGKFYITFWNDDGTHFDWYIPFPQLYHTNPLERLILGDVDKFNLNLT